MRLVLGTLPSAEKKSSFRKLICPMEAREMTVNKAKADSQRHAPELSPATFLKGRETEHEGFYKELLRGRGSKHACLSERLVWA